MDSKFGLVLEGGGFRGCYTAGALKWLYDHKIMFQYSVSISAASAYAFLYHAGMMKELHDISTVAVKDKKFIGIVPLLREGGLMGSSYLKDKYLLPCYKKGLEILKASSREAEIGVFNLNKEQLEYHGKDRYDEQGELIRASCILPLSAKSVTIDGENYMDGGVDTMVSIQRCIETNHKKILVIVTKDKHYVRKPNGIFLTNAIRLVYSKYKKMLKTLDGRVKHYYDEMKQVYQMEKDGLAMLIRPSRDTGVGRFSGNREQIESMFNLGWQDMEDHKSEIYKFLEIE